MPEQCPNCLFRRVGRKNFGKKAAGVVGASAGVILGDVLDERVLDNLRCLNCGYSFSAAPHSPDDNR